MVQQSRLESQREYLIQLLNQLTAEYQTLQSEIGQIAKQYPGSDDEFAFMEEFELLLVSICGYAKQIQTTGTVRAFDSAIAHLQQCQVFTNSAIAQFYAEAKWQYPNMQGYLQRLDYLRLLTLEYLQMQQTIQPIAV